MAVILFTMRDIEKQYAEFADWGEGRRRTRTSALPAYTIATGPSKFRPEAAEMVDPFQKVRGPSIVQQVKQAAKDTPTFLRKTKRGGIAIVKKGLRKSKKAIAKITSPGVKAGVGNISTGVRQMAGDVAVASRRYGRGAIRHLGANKGKYALAGAALGGAGYLLRDKTEMYSRYSRRPTSIYFSRR